MGFPTPPRLLGRPSHLTRTFWLDSRPLSDLRVGLSTPLGHPGGTAEPSQTFRWASRTFAWASRSLPHHRVCFPPLPDRRVGLSHLLDLRVGLPNLHVGLPIPTGPPSGSPTYPRPMGGIPDLSRISEWASRPLLDLRVGLPTRPGPLGGPLDPSRTSGWASRPLLNLWVGFQTPPGPSGWLPTPPGSPGGLPTTPGPSGGPFDLSRIFG